MGEVFSIDDKLAGCDYSESVGYCFDFIFVTRWFGAVSYVFFFRVRTINFWTLMSLIKSAECLKMEGTYAFLFSPLCNHDSWRSIVRCKPAELHKSTVQVFSHQCIFNHTSHCDGCPLQLSCLPGWSGHETIKFYNEVEYEQL
jgi:hypothetical protein